MPRRFQIGERGEDWLCGVEVAGEFSLREDQIDFRKNRDIVGERVEIFSYGVAQVAQNPHDFMTFGGFELLDAVV